MKLTENQIIKIAEIAASVVAVTAVVWMPFALLGFLRALFWAAGGEWSEPGAAAVLSMVFGVPIGGALTIAFQEWNND